MKRQWDLHKNRTASINTLTFINGIAKIRLCMELAQNNLQEHTDSLEVEVFTWKRLTARPAKEPTCHSQV